MYGLPYNLIKCIEAFLCFRSQKVKINNILSNQYPELSGIPQGSVLGPLLFIIYVNDLAGVCDSLCNIFMFADDEKMYKHVTNVNDYQQLLQCCQELIRWSDLWCMKVNVNKCKVLSLTRNNIHKVIYDYDVNVNNKNVKLEQVEIMKDLGVWMKTMITLQTK